MNSKTEEAQPDLGAEAPTSSQTIKTEANCTVPNEISGTAEAATLSPRPQSAVTNTNKRTLMCSTNGGGENTAEPSSNEDENHEIKKVKVENVDGEADERNGAALGAHAPDVNELAGEGVAGEAGSSLGAAVARVKDEPVSDDETDADKQPSCSGVANPADVKKAVKIEKVDASSTTSRESCRFGIRCYRRNLMHRAEEAHPGDPDYRRPSFPSPPPGTPDCPYGHSCYRRNPVHFQQFTHPPDTNFEVNYRKRRQQRRNAARQNNNLVADDWFSDDEEDEEDPFADSDDDEYAPSGGDEESEEYTEEFCADYDDGDKVEE